MLWMYVACGGAIGAVLRYGVSLLLPMSLGNFPWATWWVNILGCCGIGLFAAASEKFSFLQTEWRLFLVVGVLGGFTTFSSFGLEVMQMLKHQFYPLAFWYAGSSLIIGILMVLLSYSVLKALI